MAIWQAFARWASLMGRFATSPIRCCRIRSEINSLNRGLRWARTQEQFQDMLDRREALLNEMESL